MKFLQELKSKISKNLFKNKGEYSANKTLLFFLICVFFISLLMGKSLNNAAFQIKSNFLKITKLENHTEWDSFYYTTNSESQEFEALQAAEQKMKNITSRLLSDAEKNKDNMNQLTTNISQLEEQLASLKTTMSELKKIKEENKKLEEEEADKKPETETTEEKTEIDSKLETDLVKTEEKKYQYTALNPLNILMVGDSQMQSIAPGFKRLIGNKSAIRVDEIAVHSSGFIRGDYYNWQKKLTTVFKQNKGKYDIAVILLGMNDYQNFYDRNGKVLVKETKKWEEEYHKKIRNIIDILLINTKKVYWIGMPRVRDRVYNENLLYIERIQNDLAEKYANPNLIKFSPVAVAPGIGVPYTDIITTKEGAVIKLMRNDGIHYTFSGSEFIMRKFLSDLYSDWDIEPMFSP